MEKCIGVSVAWQGFQLDDFLRGEEAAGDFGLSAAVVDFFDVDAEGACLGNADECETAAVGQVEVEVGRVMAEGGFAVGAVVELEAGGVGLCQGAEDEAECAAGGDEVVAMFGEAEAGGAVLFAGGKEGAQVVEAGEVEVEEPDGEGVRGEEGGHETLLRVH